MVVNSIFLVGFMGCGKSTVGQQLARRLAWRFIDLDEQIEKTEGRTIAEIFAQGGEAPFRRLENEALRKIVEESARPGGRVIALGGGTFVQPANQELLQRARAITVWLECPVEELLLRCALMTNRPLFRDESNFRALYELRAPYYRQATFTVPAGNSTPDEVVDRILSLKPFQGLVCCT
ncbi:MAG: shikimate kinase [Acidobacteria bacterium]|nr:shikimate kinase [Acidobacteriota bacterium]